MSSATPEPKEEIRFDGFSDFFKVLYRQGVFVIEFGQGVRQPATVIARIWTDASSAKALAELLQKMIKEYEDKIGKI